jgi:hypothetical protein
LKYPTAHIRTKSFASELENTVSGEFSGINEKLKILKLANQKVLNEQQKVPQSKSES